MNIRLTVATSILSIFLLLPRVLAQDRKAYKIVGKIGGLPSNQIVLLIRNKITGGSDTLSKSRTDHNGNFIFHGTISHEGEAHFIKFDNIDSLRFASLNKEKYVRIILESGITKITGNINNLSITAMTITGSKSSEEYRDYIVEIDKLNRYTSKRIDSLSVQYRRQQIDLGNFRTEHNKVISSMRVNLMKLVETWLSNHTDSYISPWVIMTNGSDNIVWMEKKWDQLSEASQKSYYGNNLRLHLEQSRKVAIGAIAPNFNINTEKKHKLNLHDIAAKGNYTLLYFWASWCSPCITSIPHLKEIYARYKGKGLNIIGYSIDQNEKKWDTILKQRGIAWYNIIEVGQFAKFEYGISEIPHYFILNKKGEILAHYMDSKSVEEKLNTLIK